MKKICQIWPRRPLKHFTAAYRGFPPCTQSQPPINRETGYSNVLVRLHPGQSEDAFFAQERALYTAVCTDHQIHYFCMFSSQVLPIAGLCVAKLYRLCQFWEICRFKTADSVLPPCFAANDFQFLQFGKLFNLDL